jgi:hypothetical protein
VKAYNSKSSIQQLQMTSIIFHQFPPSGPMKALEIIKTFKPPGIWSMIENMGAHNIPSIPAPSLSIC